MLCNIFFIFIKTKETEFYKTIRIENENKDKLIQECFDINSGYFKLEINQEINDTLFDNNYLHRFIFYKNDSNYPFISDFYVGSKRINEENIPLIVELYSRIILLINTEESLILRDYKDYNVSYYTLCSIYNFTEYKNLLPVVIKTKKSYENKNQYITLSNKVEDDEGENKEIIVSNFKRDVIEGNIIERDVIENTNIKNNNTDNNNIDNTNIKNNNIDNTNIKNNNIDNTNIENNKIDNTNIENNKIKRDNIENNKIKRDNIDNNKNIIADYITSDNTSGNIKFELFKNVLVNLFKKLRFIDDYLGVIERFKENDIINIYNISNNLLPLMKSLNSILKNSTIMLKNQEKIVKLISLTD